MIRAARTTLTLIFLVAVLFAGGIYGWTRLTAPLPSQDEAPVCVATTVTAGTKLTAGQVTVSVFNASNRSGLAGRTLDQLTDAGFVSDAEGNAPEGTSVRYAQIWADDPTSPDVRLVKRYLGKQTVVVPGERLGLGVVVVVGDTFEQLAKKSGTVTVKNDVSICSPPTDLG